MDGTQDALVRLQQALLSHPMVADCAVVLRSPTANPRLHEPVAYVVASGPFLPERLRSYLHSVLPDLNLPTAYVPLTSLPLTQEGEVDVEALSRLVVIDAGLVSRWEEQLQAVGDIAEVAVVVQEEIPVCPPLHLSDVLPHLPGSSARERCPQEPEARYDSEEARRELRATPALSLSEGPPLLLHADAPKTLAESLLLAATRTPHKEILYVQSDGTHRTQSYVELLSEAERILGGLRGLGLQPGAKVLFQLEHNHDFIPAFWGCVLGGFVPVPLSIAPTYDQINSAISKLHNAWSLLERPVILTGKDLEASVRSLSDLLHIEAMQVVTVEVLRASERDRAWHASQPDDMAMMLLTSGSTGIPKAVLQRHSSLLSRSAASAQHTGLHGNDVVLNWFPMDHVGGIVMFHLQGLYVGCGQVHAPTEYVLRDALRWLDLVDRYRITVTWAPNFAYGLINARAEELARRTWDLSSLGFILNAGEAIVAATARRFLELLLPHGLPPTAMRPSWGMSETCSAVTYSDRFTLDQTSESSAFVEVGSPIPGFRMRIVDEAGQLVDEGKTGRLEVQGPSVTAGYYHNEEANAEIFTEVGWFNTGDMGMLREGRLTITGRHKDVIIVNGLNFYSHELEAVVEEAPGVEVSYTAACAVRGLGSETDELAIFFHASESTDGALVTLLNEIRDRVVRSMGINPKYLIPVERSAIPKTQIGKIQRSALRARFEGGEFASILKQVDILSGSSNTLPGWFYRPVWRRKVGVRVDLADISTRRTLVFVDDSGLGDALCETWIARPSSPIGPGTGSERDVDGSAASHPAPHSVSCLRVEAGSAFSRLSEAHYGIAPSDPSHYRRLLEAVVAEGGPVQQIVHLWTYAPYPDEPSSPDALEQAQERGLYSLLGVVQAVAEVQGPDHPVRVLVVSSYTQATRPEDVLACERTPLLGLVKAVSQEMPSLTCTHLDLPMDPAASEVSSETNGAETNRLNGAGDARVRLVLAELARTVDREVAYRDGHRLVVRLERADLLHAPKQAAPFKTGGLYLLTGGLGGIGVEVARHLLSRYNARLLLIGRSPLSERLEAYQSLQSLGGEVRYETLDVCDLQGLQSAVARVEAEWGCRLLGMLHLAGLNQAGLVVEETRESLAAAMRPKLGGSWTVGQLMKERPDALFIGFSSTLSFFDQAMFGAYAAGNRYLDSLCHALRHQAGIRSVCFGWSSWDEIGMSRTQPGQDPIRAIGRGFQSLSSEQGVYSLLAGLYAGAAHLLVGLDGSNSYIRRHCEQSGEELRSQHLYAYFTTTAASASAERAAFEVPVVRDRFGTRSACELIGFAEMPRTEAGEIDRAQLADRDRRRRSGNQERVAPRTDVERCLAEIWQQLLGVPQVGVYDNFFALGGHSLLATQVISRIRDAFGVDLPGTELFKASTIAGLAERIGMALGEEAVGAPPLTRISREGRIPLSFAQQRLWFVHQLDMQSSAYNIPNALQLIGPLDVGALERSIQEIVWRHEALRTTFADDPNRHGAEPIQVIGNSVAALEVVDLGALGPYAREQEMHRLLAEAAQRPFDLERGPLFRTSLLRLGEEEHILLLSMHHSVSDGWSMGVLMRELEALYNAFSAGLPSPLSELPIQYADYAVWQRDWLQGEVLQRQMSYWKEHLAGAPALLELPTDRQRPPVQTFRGARKQVELSAALTQRLKVLGQRKGTTLFMTLLAAFQLLLARYSGQDDVVVGTAIANRTRAEVEGLIGFFANTLALRTDLSGDPSFAELLDRVRKVCMSAYAHQDLPFEKLVEELQPVRDVSRHPLFQVALSLQNAPMRDLRLSGVSVETLEMERKGSPFDLTLSLSEGIDGTLSGVLEYNTALFTAETISRMVGHLHMLLEGVLANPEARVSRVPLLCEAERHEMLVEWNDTAADYPCELCVHELFEAQVDRTPEAVAVVLEEEQLTYSELNRRANQLAHYLHSLGVGPEVLVGLCVERSVAMVVGMLGILKAGGAYLPLDPDNPLHRLHTTVEDAQSHLLLCDASSAQRLHALPGRILTTDADALRSQDHSADNLLCVTTPEHLAYVMYTSGSTGQPKGVAVPHRAITRLVCGATYCELGPDEVILQCAPLAFDASTFEIWATLLNGGRLVLFNGQTPSLEELGEAIRRHAVSTLWLTAGLFHAMVESNLEGLQGLRQLLAGGDVLSAAHVQQALEGLRGCRLINGYGPTENTTFTCCYAMNTGLSVSGSIPIGRPVSNTQVYVLDARMEPVPVGVAGELYAGGDGVARGYLKGSDLTAERFVPDPFRRDPGSRLYRTGDQVRWRADGQLEFVGRIDHQVKIRGFRIELGEIESVLLSHPSVHDAVVLAREDMPGEKRLLAYITAHPHSVPNETALRAYLKKALPEYMVPAAFVMLDALPLTPNGKVDRKALPAPDALPTTHREQFRAPNTPTEAALVRIWEELFNVRPIDVRDNFFQLGGHSLLAARLFARVEHEFGKRLPLATLFQSPTLGEIAALLEDEPIPLSWRCLVPIKPEGERAPFFCAHPLGGNLLYFRFLSNSLADDQPFYGIQAHGRDAEEWTPSTVEEMASHYIEEICSFQPTGPYYLGGVSGGGSIAYEMARQLVAKGERVALLALLDTYLVDPGLHVEGAQRFQHPLMRQLLWLDGVLGNLLFDQRSKAGSYVAQRMKVRLDTWWARLRRQPLIASERELPESLRGVRAAIRLALASYRPGPYAGRVTQFLVRETRLRTGMDPRLLAGDLAEGGLEVHFVDGDHLTMLNERHVRVLASKLQGCLDRAAAVERMLEEERVEH